jgi:hypothetical protein
VSETEGVVTSPSKGKDAAGPEGRASP